MSFDFPGLVKNARKQLGMSQSALAHAAGVSLPSIQKLESGDANPGIRLLEPIFRVLGLSLSVQHSPLDWDALAHLGVPITAAVPSRDRFKARPDGATLAHLLGLAATELSHSPTTAETIRKREALIATLLALHHYYPAFFHKHCNRVPALQALFPAPPARLDGRLIKLKRQALARISEYL